MKRNSKGRYVEAEARGQRHNAFIPEPLPPQPSLRWDHHCINLLGDAAQALGYLGGTYTFFKDADAIRNAYIRKEALLSSHIEGFQSTLEDMLLQNLGAEPRAPREDAREVLRCEEAMTLGWQQIDAGTPISNHMLLNLHAVLMRGNRRLTPGKFRRDQVWIGNSRTGEVQYVPPPGTEVEPCMQDLQAFLQDEDGRAPALILAGLAHVQFETIHPFLDGNGRVGRMLISFMLDAPLLYLSLFLKHNQREYYELLNEVRLSGNWEAWMEFFLQGVLNTAKAAVHAGKRINALFTRNQEIISSDAARRTSSALKLHNALKKELILSIPEAAELTGLTYPTVAAAVEWLVQNGILIELTGKRSRRIYCYNEYYNILTEDIG